MSYLIVHLEQGSEKWLTYRKTKIGASDAATILGISPWASPYDLWLEKTGQKEPRKINPAMRRGTELEPLARMKVEELLGICLDPLVIESQQYPWMIASLDGINEDNTKMVEIKCAGEKDHSCAKMGKVPEKYVPQLQHQLAVIGLEKMYYYSFDGNDGMLLTVERDQEYIDRLIEAERVFYECVMQRIPPDCRETRIQQMDDERWELENFKYWDAKNQIEFWEERMQTSKENLIDMSGGLEAQGMGFKLSKVVKKGNINWDDVCKTYQISESDCENFRKPSSEYWTIKREKE